MEGMRMREREDEGTRVKERRVESDRENVER